MFPPIRYFNSYRTKMIRPHRRRRRLSDYTIVAGMGFYDPPRRLDPAPPWMNHGTSELHFTV